MDGALNPMRVNAFNRILKKNSNICFESVPVDLEKFHSASGVFPLDTDIEQKRVMS